MTEEIQTDSSLDEFLYTIQNLVYSKYILIDRRISELLRAIASSDKVYNLIAECMVNFDFIEQWREAVKDNKFVLPSDENKRISFIFCMLNNIDDKNLDLTKVLDHYFSFDPSHTPYELFCKNVIIEFRDLILKKLGFSINLNGKEGEADEIVANPEIVKSDEEKLAELLKTLKDFAHSSKKFKLLIKPEDVVAVISTFEFALKKGQCEYFYALSITLKYAFKKIKELREVLNQVDCISTELIKRSWYDWPWTV